MPSLPFIEDPTVIGGLPGAFIGPTVTMRGAEEVEQLIGRLAKEVGSPGRFLRAACFVYRNYMIDNFLSGQRLRRRTGRLVQQWRPERVDHTTYRMTSGTLRYARVHEFGLDYPQQPVRGYTTRSGRKVPLYLRHMKQKERRYVRDTLIYAEPLITLRMNEVMNSIIKGLAPRKEEG